MPSGIKQAGAEIDRIQKMFGSLSHGARAFNSAIDSVGMAAANAAVSVGSVIGTALVGGLGLGIKEAFHFNQELENTQLSLANIANASGTVANLSGAFRVSGDVIKQMRQDARDLPGEFKDLQNLMGLMEAASANAGMGMFSTEKLARETMVAASMLKVPFQVAGREMSMMLSGSARHSMPLFTKLGFTDSKAFNKLSQEERTLAIREKLAKLNSPEALGMVKNTWDAMKGNIVDSFRQGAGTIGGPLYATIKERVGAALNLATTDPAKYERLKNQYINVATALGQGLVTAFETGETFINHWYGPLATFTGTMGRGFARVFGQFGPMIGGLADRFESFLNNPAAFAHMEHIAKQLIALRMGGAALQMGAGGLSAISMASGGGAGGAAAAAAMALPLVAVLGLATLAAEGFTHALTDQTSYLHDASVKAGKRAVEETASLTKGLASMFVTLQPIADYVGYSVVTTFSNLVSVVNFTIDNFNKFSTMLGFFWDKAFGQKLGVSTDTYDYDKDRNDSFTNGMYPTKLFNAPAEPGDIGAKKPPEHHTTIHKVEIKVDGEADPQRVAKLTVDMLFEKARNPLSSSGGPPRFDR